MNFKQWLLSEEIFPNKTATVYHRTKYISSISDILKSGFRTGSGCLYGCGLYTTFSLADQFKEYMVSQYGNYIVKFKVTNLNEYLICQLSVAQQILGVKYKISYQFKSFNIEVPQEVLDDFDEMQLKSTYSSDLALDIHNNWHPKIESSKCKGMIYRGKRDGYSLVKYEPVEDGTITMLAYAEVPLNDFEKFNSLSRNEGWTTSTKTAKIKSVYSLPVNKEKHGDIVDPKDEFYKNLFYAKDISHMARKIGKEAMNSLSDAQVYQLVDKDKDTDNTINAIIKYKKNLTSTNVHDLLSHAKDIKKVAETLGEENISKLEDKHVSYLFDKLGSKFMSVLMQYKKELSSNDVYTLLSYTRDKEKLAETLGEENISKLSGANVNDLFKHSIKFSIPPNLKKEKASFEEILNILLKYKNNLSDVDVSNILYFSTKKYDDDEVIYDIIQNLKDKNQDISERNVYGFLYYSKDREKLAETLGAENISKLNYDYIYKLIDNPISQNVKNQFASILNRYHKNKTPEISKIIIDNLPKSRFVEA